MIGSPARSRPGIRQIAVVVALGTALAAFVSFGPAAAGGGSNGTGKPEAFATIGKIYSPTIEVKKKGADDFKTAEEGDELKVGDTVRTDATGRVRINYADDSYTRLDFDTSFKIEKLSDDQGNRQVKGTLEDGNAWHRTAALTESQTFEQSGAGATAAAIGTAFAIECDAPTHCVFIAVVDGIRQEGTGGVFNPLEPLQFCESTNGVLCDEVQNKTIADMIQDLWIQWNLYLDLLEFGLPPGPFFLSGTVVIENGQIQSITVAPGTPTGGTPGPTAPTLGSPPIGCQGTCQQGPLGSFSLPAGFTPGNSIETVEDGSPVVFVANVDNPSGLPYYIVFTTLPNDEGPDVGVVSFCDPTCNPVSKFTRYDQTTGTFQFQPTDNVAGSQVEGIMTFHVETNYAPPTGDASIAVTVSGECECGDGGSVGQGQATNPGPPPATSPPPAADPPTTSPPPTPPPEQEAPPDWYQP